MLDILIKNTKIVDGTGKSIYQSDVGIKDGKIKLIKTNIETEAETTIDCKNKLVLSPGFIDTHSHGDIGIFVDPFQKTKLFQGVTTDICGNCGITVAPVNKETFELLKSYLSGCIMPREWEGFNEFSKYLNAVQKLDLGINIGYFVGHGTIRIAVMGMDNRPPSKDELEHMKDFTREAMESGAFGLSSGLIYPPGVFAEKKELIQLCKVVKEYNGVYATHMRNESYNLIEGVKEAIDIGRKSGVKVLISHHKAVGKENFGKSIETLKLVDEAVKEGIDIRLDQYPYTACSTALNATIPPEYHEGGVEKLVERLKDSKSRAEIKKRIFGQDNSWDNLVREAGFENILVLSGKNTPEVIGKTVKEYAEIINKEPIDVLFEILIKNNGTPNCVEFAMDEEDIERIMKYPLTMIGSDSGVVEEGSMFHPRTVGTFPRVLGRYVRDKKVISLEEAVKRMTSIPAQFLGLTDKGHIKEGYDADLVIFDFETIIDKSDYLRPHQQNEGIKYVILNGEIAAIDNKCLNKPVGKVLKI